MQFYWNQLAATNYDCNAYGSGDYNNTSCSTSTGVTPNDGTLSATGTDITVGLIGGVLLITTAIALFIKMRHKKATK